MISASFTYDGGHCFGCQIARASIADGELSEGLIETGAAADAQRDGAGGARQGGGGGWPWDRPGDRAPGVKGGGQHEGLHWFWRYNLDLTYYILHMTCTHDMT